MKDDEYYMNIAIKEAKKAYNKGEVPVGSVLVDNNGIIISKGYNKIESLNDPTAHAELVTIRKASNVLKSWRLYGTTIYTTLEPCLMCLGAMLQSRIKRLVYGTKDPKVGSTDLVKSIINTDSIGLEIEVINSGLNKKCSKILKDFFDELRKTNKLFEHR